MAKINTLQDSFLAKLQALYDIENEIIKALPKMVEAASDPELKDALSSHLEETKEQAHRLEQAFEMLEEKPKKLKAEGVRGIIEDGKWVMDADAPDALKDAMLASAARYVEHYEMAGYMSAIEEASLLGYDDIAELLSDSLSEENAADDKLVSVMKDSMDESLTAVGASEEEE